MVAGDTLVPFRQYVLKVFGRCDLACDHCYVFEHADQGWRGRTAALGDQTAKQIVARIGEHVAEHRLDWIRAVLHGGEPLLYGRERTRDLLTMLTAELPSPIRLDLQIHTNGVRLDEAFLELFLEFGVKVGVSLDGDRSANDLHRLFVDGRSSHPQVLQALELLRRPRYQDLYAGVLCTIDIRNDPHRVFDAIAAERPPRVDLLLPHATWENPPLRLGAGGGAGAGPEPGPEYAAWLAVVYDRWTAAGRPFPIRTFESIADALRGLPSRTEALGLAPRDLVVIETDGSIEQADSLKTAYDGAAATGFNVFEHSLDEAAAHAGIAARQGGTATLCAACRACPVVEVCGGGLYAHRYRPESGFDNPSVYCDDLKALIGHVGAGEVRRQAEAAIPDHSVSRPDFEVLASGFGDASVIRRLGEPQLSLCRALVQEVALRVDPASPFTEAVREIARLDAADRPAFESVLADPYTRVWAVRLLERDVDVFDDPADLSRLSELAAGAALATRAAVRLPLQVLGGVLHLPGLGALAVGGSARAAEIQTRGDGTMTFLVDGRAYDVDPFGTDTAVPEWLPRHSLRAEGWSVALEDTDPYRNCHQWAAADRLTAEVRGHWQRRFGDAAAYLERRLPEYLPGLRAALAVLMPMVPPPSGCDRSGAARHAYGSVGLALPADGPTMASLLIHEFQHVKLGALLDVYDFFDLDDQRLYYAPWREDPRPLEGLYQGTYAHLAVTDYWRVRRHDAPDGQRDAAEANFARWRLHTAEAVDVLLGSGSLTHAGQAFARGMAETVAPWLAEPVAPAALDAARQASDRHRRAWERHVRATA